jgi:hypothetical protein
VAAAMGAERLITQAADHPPGAASAQPSPSR